MVGKNYLCSIISIKIHFICKVLHCSGKSDTKGLMCNYVYVLCIYKHTHTECLVSYANKKTRSERDIYPIQ